MNVRCYDNGGETADRYTVVFTGRYRHKTRGSYLYLGMSARPTHPQGFGQHGESNEPIDRPRYAHLGTRIEFHNLPAECQAVASATYNDLWN